MFAALLERVARKLEELGVPYMVIGGQAVLLHGEPRLTRDIDITLGTDTGGLDPVLDLAKQEGWKVLVENPSEFVSRTMVLPCLDTQSGIRLDLIFSTSEYERQAIGRVQRQRVGHTEVRFASVEDVIIHNT